jgi:hypothetical protein
MENLNLKNVENERNNIKDSYDLELYDFKMFKNCQERLDNMHRQKQDVYECSISDFGEAIADGKALDVEYKALEKAYRELHDRLYPIMEVCYKGYKAHSDWVRMPYTYYEEFETPYEDDIYHLLGLD